MHTLTREAPLGAPLRSPSIIITKMLQTRRRVKTIRISRAGNYDVVRAMPRLLLPLLSRRVRVLRVLGMTTVPFISYRSFLFPLTSSRHSSIALGRFLESPGFSGSRSLRLFPIAGCMRNFIHSHFPLSSLLRRPSVDNVFYSMETLFDEDSQVIARSRT